MKLMNASRFLCAIFLAGCLAGLPLEPLAAETTILTGKVMTTVTRAPFTHFNGTVEEVMVTPGRHVKVGDPLLKYTLQDDARRNLQREVNNGASTQGMRAQILDMQRQLAQVQAQRNKARSLVDNGLGSSQAFGRLEQDVTSLNSRIALTRDSIGKAEDNFKVRLNELSGYFDQPIREGETLPRFLYLKSPIDGYVLAVDASMNPGATFGAGFAPIRIGQMDPMLIQVPVYEAELATIKVGDRASVEIPSLGNKKYEATVTEIAWVSNDMNVSTASYYNVELSIPNPQLELKPGFKAVVRFGK